MRVSSEARVLVLSVLGNRTISSPHPALPACLGAAEGLRPALPSSEPISFMKWEKPQEP